MGPSWLVAAADSFLSKRYQGLVAGLAEEAAANAETKTLSEGTGYGVLYGAIGAVLLVATIWPQIWYRRHNKKYTIQAPDEEFISGRGTQKWWSITASFFSTAMGTWVLTAPADVGAAYGWFGTIGYALATSVPFVFFAYFGPMMRERTQGRGFTQANFLRRRLNFWVHLLYVAVSVGTMFLAFVVEAVTIAAIYSTISPSVNTPAVILSIGVVTLIYTMLSGVRSTFLTDRVQFIVLSLLILIGCSGMMAEARPKIPSGAFNKVANWTGEGFVALLVLNISCWFPTFSDPSSWGRMYAAESPQAARKGLLIGAAVLLIPMIFFGASGMLAQAALNEGVATPADSTFFSLIAILHPGWSVLMLLLATCMSTSTIDTYCSGFAMAIAAEIGIVRARDVNFCRIGVFGVFCLSMWAAVENPPSIMTLFMIGNLMACCTTPVLLASLWPIVTPLSSFIGMLSGALSILTIGWAHSRTFVGGFKWWEFPEGSMGNWALLTFCVAALTTTVVCLGAAQIEFALNPAKRQEQVDKLAALAEPKVGEGEIKLSTKSSSSRLLEDELLTDGDAVTVVTHRQPTEASIRVNCV